MFCDHISSVSIPLMLLLLEIGFHQYYFANYLLYQNLFILLIYKYGVLHYTH